MAIDIMDPSLSENIAPNRNFMLYGMNDPEGAKSDQRLQRQFLIPLSFAIKESDQLLDTDTTMQDDTLLFLPLVASTRYIFQGGLFVTSNAAADFKFQFTIPVAASGKRFTGSYSGGTAAESVVSISTATVVTVSNTNEFYVRFEGLVQTAINEGDLQLQWAQNVSDAVSTTVKEGSWLRLSKETNNTIS